MPHISKFKNQKLNFHAGKGIIVGYGGSNQYRIWSSVDNKVTVTAYADFINEVRKSIPTGVEPAKVIHDIIEVLHEPSTTPAENNEEVTVAVKDEDIVENEDIAEDEVERQTISPDGHEIRVEPDSTYLNLKQPRFPSRQRASPMRYEPEK